MATVWRALWPRAIPEHEYETALMMAQLAASSGRKAAAPLDREDEAPARRTPARQAPAADDVSVTTAAEMIGRSSPAVYSRIKKGDISWSGKPMRLSRVDVERVAAELRGEPAPASAPSAEAAARLLTSRQAADILGVTASGVAYNANAGNLRIAMRKGRLLFFSRGDVTAFAKGRKGQRPRGPARREKPKPDAEPELPFESAAAPSAGPALTGRQAAQALKVSPSIIFRAIKSGVLKAEHINGKGSPMRVLRADLEKFRAERSN